MAVCLNTGIHHALLLNFKTITNQYICEIS
jgi:hypothetical protein